MPDARLQCWRALIILECAATFVIACVYLHVAANTDAQCLVDP